MNLIYDNLNINFTLDNIEFTLLNAAHEKFNQPVPLHSHGKNCFEFHYVLDGFGVLHADNEYHLLRPNTLYTIRPHTLHEQLPNPTSPITEYSIYLKAIPCDEKPLFFINENKPTFWIGEDTHQLFLLFKQIFQELKEQKIGYSLQIQALLQQFLIYYIRFRGFPASSRKASSHKYNLTDSRTLIIEKCFLYDYKSITLNILAKQLSLSTRQTERFIKSCYNKTFQQKRNDARMSAATALLTHSNLSVSIIAEQTGYSSVEHFSYAFKRIYHMSPTAYRKSKEMGM